ncbi:MAG: Gfo/Idh/MocA family protein [Planctomycetota bacterium]|jgi:predicted dehydrogenase
MRLPFSGSIAQLHAGAFEAAGARLAGFCDPRLDRAEAMVQKHGGTAVADVDALLAMDEVTAVIIAVPNHLHGALARKALEAGKDVLLEKPMALDVAQCDEILAVAEKGDRILQLGFVCRGAPTAVAAQRFIEAGRLGTIYHAKASIFRRRGIPGLGRWFTNRDFSGGGVLIDIGVHLIDLVMYLTGYKQATRVSGHCTSTFGLPIEEYTHTEMWAGPPDPTGRFDVEDAASALIRFEGDFTLDLNVTWACNMPNNVVQDGIVLLGRRGGLFIDVWGNRMSLATEDQGILEDVEANVGADDPWSQGWRRQADRFLEAVESRSPPHATGVDGRRVQAILDAIYRSSEAGCEVEIR